MRQKWTRQTFDLKEWRKFYSSYPSDNPSHTTHFTRNWSQDLEVSFPHHTSLLGKTNSDLGGPFHVVRRHYSESSTLGSGDHVFQHPVFTDSGTFVGPQFAKLAGFNNSHFPSLPPPDILDLEAFGRKAISEVAPTSSNFNGSAFLGELREGLPYLPTVRHAKQATSKARAAGDNYLNVQFGWVPLTSDLSKFFDTVRNGHKIIEDYKKNSGKLIHRSYKHPTHLEFSSTEEAGFPAPLIDQTNLYESGGYIGTLTTNTTYKVERWFKGTFMYHFPFGNRFNEIHSELNKLYGIDVTPEMIWELAPWSWAADWFTDGGTLMRNLTLFGNDNLVMPHAYVMEHKTKIVEYILHGIRYKSYPGDQTFRQTFISESKTRVQANPYGFGLTFDGLSRRQLAILAALGLSRHG